MGAFCCCKEVWWRVLRNWTHDRHPRTCPQLLATPALQCVLPSGWAPWECTDSGCPLVPKQAADIVRIVGIGRNEYIATMNKCKGKKLLWRVNKAIVREHLPPEPLPLDTQPWWIAHVVNLGACALLLPFLALHVTGTSS